MSYVIRPESLKTFVEDESIKLPRFQRKSTWNDKSNFELCISIFSGYPTGVCVLEKNRDTNGRNIKWLLDGRQRRNAMTKIWEDPEVIYSWAKKWIGFKNSDQPSEVREKFKEKLENYLERDEEDTSKEKQDIEPLEAGDIDITDNIDHDDQQENIVILKQKGHELLCDIITLVHNKKKGESGFSRYFNFSKFVDKLPYEEYSDDGHALNSRKLVSFIDAYKLYCKDEKIDFNDKETFNNFLNSRLYINNPKQLEKHLNKYWEEIQNRIDLIYKIRDILSNSLIGLIEIEGFSPCDSQMIFNIINSKGTHLKAVEILSARPSWNVVIKNPSEEQEKQTKQLYKTLGVSYSDTVKWDLAATLLDRLNDTNIFYKLFDPSSTSDFEKKITYGFKLLAGIYTKGVKKEDIEKLGSNPNLNWDRDIESLIYDINCLTNLILCNDYFKYLKSWKYSLMNILSDTICLNFMIVMYLDWVRKGKPVGNGGIAKMVQKNAYILLDQLIYEYITNQWKGSSDSKIAKNISELKNKPDIFEPITEQNWKTLLNKIMYDEPLTGGIEAVLCHHYCTRHIAGPDNKYKSEVDHIIPQRLFKGSCIKESEKVKDGLFNLALLPKDENISKSDKTLKEITSDWLKDEIEKYEFVNKSDFDKFSDISNIEDLKKQREKVLINKFIEDRKKILLNE